nr:YezD family protein [Kroppenstedtia pulmonis]
MEEITDRIREMLSTMQFGSITLVVQNGKVIQLEKNEKLRLR